MTSLIVGITGKAGTGKDTMAARLRSHGFAQVSFAEPLKRFAQEVFDFSDDQLWGPSKMRNAPDPRWRRPDGSYLTPREALQTLGTEWGRRCHPDLWVRLAIRKALELGGPVVISDMRFRNEVEAIRAVGVTVRLRRAGVVPLTAGVPGHASEAEMDEIPDGLFHWTLEAAEGLPAFHAQIDAWLAFVQRGAGLPRAS